MRFGEYDRVNCCAGHLQRPWKRSQPFPDIFTERVSSSFRTFSRGLLDLGWNTRHAFVECFCRMSDEWPAKCSPSQDIDAGPPNHIHRASPDSRMLKSQTSPAVLCRTHVSEDTLVHSLLTLLASSCSIQQACREVMEFSHSILIVSIFMLK
jgi:hypothetical protein